MKHLGHPAAVVLLVCGLSTVACERREGARVEAREVAGSTQTTAGAIATWQDVTHDWPESSKSAAREMNAKYGAPDEMTHTQLVWHRRGQWKKSVLSREEVHHEWPSPHVDVLEQFIDFRVPPDKFDDLAAFDGSVMAERTKGELSARCGGEGANFLAVNLAREIVEGTRSVDDARRFYEAAMKASKAGDKPDYMKSLRFPPPAGATSDPDRAAAAAPK